MTDAGVASPRRADPAGAVLPRGAREMPQVYRNPFMPTREQPVSFILPADLPTTALRRVLGAQRLRQQGERVREHVYLDTFDWRLWRANALVDAMAEDARVVLRWIEADSGRAVEAAPLGKLPEGPLAPPEGALGTRLAGLAGIRALLPVARLRVHTRALGVTGGAGKITVRLHLDAITPLPLPAGSPVPTPRSVDREAQPGAFPVTYRLVAAPLRGYEPQWREVADALAAHLGAAGPAEALHRIALAASPRSPGDYSSKLRVDLSPGERADTATRRALAALEATMAANEPGMLDALDPEFLHDYRVAVRRARSALAQVRDVLPASAVARFKGELAWLGAVTGPPRDLDVYLLSLPGYAKSLPPGLGNDLEPLARYLEEAREAAYADLRRALASARYRQLRARWAAFVTGAPPARPSAPAALLPIGEVASSRIWKVYKRVLREGRAIGDESPDEALHELRKTCKKLRYLIELFRSLYPAARIAPVITALKALQDNLGEHQDLAVQAAELARLRAGMAAAGRLPEATAAAMQTLSAQLLDRQHQARAEFRERFAAFSTRRNRALYRDLFKPAPVPG